MIIRNWLTLNVKKQTQNTVYICLLSSYKVNFVNFDGPLPTVASLAGILENLAKVITGVGGLPKVNFDCISLRRNAG